MTSKELILHILVNAKTIKDIKHPRIQELMLIKSALRSCNVESGEWRIQKHSEFDKEMQELLANLTLEDLFGVPKESPFPA